MTVRGENKVEGSAQELLYRVIAARLSIPSATARYVVEQNKKGSTVPFLARYRRDETGNLDETALRQLLDMAEELREVHRRRTFMLKNLKERGLLTDDLKEAFEKLVHLNQLEDAWEPFKEKRTSLAHRGREAGLEPLAKKILHTTEPIEDIAERLRCVADGEKLFQAIVVEEVQRSDEIRELMLVECRRGGVISSSLATVPRKKTAKEIGSDAFETLKKHFAAYENRRWSVQRISAHCVLALQRGENKGVLVVKIIPHGGCRGTFLAWARRRFIGLQRHEGSAAVRILGQCIDAAYEHVVKAAHNTIRRDLRKSAEKEAITVFAHSLRHILLQCPMRDARVLAMDPGVTNGVKCVALDENGGVLTRFKCTIMDVANMRDYISTCVERLKLNKIVIGNGTASRQVADIVADTIVQKKLNVEYAIVSETGASVYSVSDVAKEEFPTLDPMYRGAVNIGRRVIDPLSELVKIPVRSMGIGMYQHDISETEMLRALNRVVESCVASVGVNVLVANRYVMEKIPGVTKRLVDQIVLARYSKKLKSREDLRRVPGMTEAVYQQIAGFFRFPNSPNPLDNSNIHPESYSIVEKLLKLYVGKERADVGSILLHMKDKELEDLATRVGCGKATLTLLAQELASPALDPRSGLPHAGLFQCGPRKASDLKPGDTLVGVIRSVTTFGVFVDVGLHDDVLVRDVNIDTAHVGSLLENLRFEDRDQLGRLQVRYVGLVHARGNASTQNHQQGLNLESEDVVHLNPRGSPKEEGTLSDTLAVVRGEREKLFAAPHLPEGCSADGEPSRLQSEVISTRPTKRRRETTKVTRVKTAPEMTLIAEEVSEAPKTKRRRGERAQRGAHLSFIGGTDVDNNIGDTNPWWREGDEICLDGGVAQVTPTSSQENDKEKPEVFSF